MKTLEKDRLGTHALPNIHLYGFCLKNALWIATAIVELDRSLGLIHVSSLESLFR